ncbi:hypothetical protein V2G26_005365 [Clonostachys chloroleuca]
MPRLGIAPWRSQAWHTCTLQTFSPTRHGVYFRTVPWFAAHASQAVGVIGGLALASVRQNHHAISSWPQLSAGPFQAGLGDRGRLLSNGWMNSNLFDALSLGI